MAARYPNAPRCPNHRRNFDAYPRNSRSHPKFKVVNNQAGGASRLSFNMTVVRPVCLGGRPVYVQRFSRPRLNVLVIYIYYIGISLGQVVCKFLRRLNLGCGGEGGDSNPRWWVCPPEGCSK